MKKTIVFGGSGFIGSHVADVLTDRGYEVTIFDVDESPYLSENQKFIQGNILNKEAVEKAVAGNDIVYNFAGITDINDAMLRPVDTITTNIVGNANILEASCKHKITRFVFASSIYVYSNAGSFYRSCKQACELIIENYHKQHGLNFTILRYGSLYGPRAGDKNWLYSALKQAVEQKKIVRPGDGEEIREYIHVFDVARLSVKILDEEFKNEYVMITGNQQTRIKDLLIMIKEILNNEIRLEFIGPNEEWHYEITPYNFSPKTAKKIVSDQYVDLGQGILDLLNKIHAESKHEGRKKLQKKGEHSLA